MSHAYGMVVPMREQKLAQKLPLFSSKTYASIAYNCAVYWRVKKRFLACKEKVNVFAVDKSAPHSDLATGMVVVVQTLRTARLFQPHSFMTFGCVYFWSLQQKAKGGMLDTTEHKIC